MRHKWFSTALTFILLFLGQNSFSDTQKLIWSDLSLKKEVSHTMNSGFEFLKKSQNSDGSWSSPDFPALTGLVLFSFLKSEQYGNTRPLPEFIQKGVDYILKNVKPDGGIYKEGLPNYNTSICMMALIATNDPRYNQVIFNARRYLPTLQVDKGRKGQADNKHDGGVGYGTKEHSDLSNTCIALEALKMSEYIENSEEKEDKERELDWGAAIEFIQRCQNLPSHNDQSWASNDPENAGGFIYYPGNSKAGEKKLPNGKTTLRSYGSMTYAGLLSLIYADLAKEDERVKAAFQWLKKNYTLDENPGLKQQGLYYYYHTMAKALSIYGEKHLLMDDGKRVNWRKELSIRLIERQNRNGFWVNNNGRWWENDPILVTSYSLIALDIIAPFL